MAREIVGLVCLPYYNNDQAVPEAFGRSNKADTRATPLAHRKLPILSFLLLQILRIYFCFCWLRILHKYQCVCVAPFKSKSQL